MSEIFDELNRLQAENTRLRSELATRDAPVEALKREEGALQDEIAALERDLEELTATNNALARGSNGPMSRAARAARVRLLVINAGTLGLSAWSLIVAGWAFPEDSYGLIPFVSLAIAMCSAVMMCFAANDYETREDAGDD